MSLPQWPEDKNDMAGDAIITLHQFELFVILFLFLLTLLKIG